MLCAVLQINLTTYWPPVGTGWGRGGHHFLKIKYFITFWYFLKDCDSHHCIDDDECDGIDYGKGLAAMWIGRKPSSSGSIGSAPACGSFSTQVRWPSWLARRRGVDFGLVLMLRFGLYLGDMSSWRRLSWPYSSARCSAVYIVLNVRIVHCSAQCVDWAVR